MFQLNGNLLRLKNFPELGIDNDKPERIGFDGYEADDSIKELYLRKRVPIKYRKKRGGKSS